jgi:hypothetical protein
MTVEQNSVEQIVSNIGRLTAHFVFAPVSEVEISVAPAAAAHSVASLLRVQLAVVVAAVAVTQVMKCAEKGVTQVMKCAEKSVTQVMKCAEKSVTHAMKCGRNGSHK